MAISIKAAMAQTKNLIIVIAITVLTNLLGFGSLIVLMANPYVTSETATRNVIPAMVTNGVKTGNPISQMTIHKHNAEMISSGGNLIFISKMSLYKF